MSIRGLDALVIVFPSFHNGEAKLFIKLNSILVVDLHVQKDTIKVAVLGGYIVEHVLHHFGSNSQPPVDRQTAQRHDIEPAAVGISCVHATTNGSNHNVVIVC